MSAYERAARKILQAARVRDESGLILAIATDAVRAGYSMGQGVK